MDSESFSNLVHYRLILNCPKCAFLFFKIWLLLIILFLASTYWLLLLLILLLLLLSLLLLLLLSSTYQSFVRDIHVETNKLFSFSQWDIKIRKSCDFSPVIFVYVKTVILATIVCSRSITVVKSICKGRARCSSGNAVERQSPSRLITERAFIGIFDVDEFPSAVTYARVPPARETLREWLIIRSFDKGRKAGRIFATKVFPLLPAVDEKRAGCSGIKESKNNRPLIRL